MIALEARRLHAVSLVERLKESREQDELTQIMVDYALQGLKIKYKRYILEEI